MTYCIFMTVALICSCVLTFLIFCLALFDQIVLCLKSVADYTRSNMVLQLFERYINFSIIAVNFDESECHPVESNCR